MRRIASSVGLLLTGAMALALLKGLPPAGSSVNPMGLTDTGIGPLTLGRDFREAESAAFQVAAESAFSGVGCGGSSEIRYDGWLGERFVGVMAMSSRDRIESVEITPHATARVGSQDECRKFRDGFAEPFLSRFGPFDSSWQVIKPVSQETLARTGPVVITARWFESGGDCYVGARFGDRLDDGVRLNI